MTLVKMAGTSLSLQYAISKAPVRVVESKHWYVASRMRTQKT